MFEPELKELESAIIGRNPLVATRLRRGLRKDKVRAMLDKSKIRGEIEPVVDLYSWKNGTVFDEALRLSGGSFFPQDNFHFIELKRAILDMNAYGECMCSCFSNLSQFANRFLPIFWDYSTSWLALDLKPSNNSPVVIIRYFSEEPSLSGYKHNTNPPREAYKTFYDFIADAILANKNNTKLSCFNAAA